MQQQQHQGGAYGAPPQDMGPFSPPPAPGPVPLSSRPPPPTQQQQQPQPSYDGFPDDDMLGGDSGGNSGGGLGSGGNRWPREETLALIRIRSEMDATFRDATLKGPLWEEVSRKLAELGYKRNAKKCKEKFENVHKYYKRTKEGRAGRQDGKSYRFFQELEALHGPMAHSQQLQPASTAPPQLHAFAAPPPMSIMPPPPGPIQPAPISSAAPAAAAEHPQPPPVSLQGLSFPSMSESESDADDSEDDEMTAETGGSPDGLGKRKRGGSRKMMAFFEGLMKQVIQRQEEMQLRFLETMEKREAERTAREEAWRRQEVARLNREQEQLAHERAAAASRDASIIAFLQRIGAQTMQVPPVVIPMPMQVQTPPPAKQPRQQLPPPLPPSQATPQPKPIQAAPLQQQAPPIKQKQQPPLQQQQQQHHQTPPPPPPPQPQHKETATHQEAGTPRSAPTPPSVGSSLELVPVSTEQHIEAAGHGGGGESGGGASSSRWPKTEVHALIQLRMDMDNRYQENGPKGPLWEEISAGMRRLGYNRNSKRCKEKWENINKYFKKVKESNKRRPEDSKTCPYFHQLEAIYRKKHTGSGAAANAVNAVASVSAVTEPQLSLNRHEIEGKRINDIDKRDNGGIGAAQVPTSNGAQTTPPTARFDIDLGAKKKTL
ncbi:unnamed protein product [Alopecurus aequalis]